LSTKIHCSSPMFKCRDSSTLNCTLSAKKHKTFSL
jgi:hypothetical protein